MITQEEIDKAVMAALKERVWVVPRSTLTTATHLRYCKRRGMFVTAKVRPS